MSVNKISEAILGVGVDDTTIDLFEKARAVHFRHAHVGDHQIDVLTFEYLQAGLAALGRVDRVAAFAQQSAQGGQDAGFVVDQQKRDGGCAGFGTFVHFAVSGWVVRVVGGIDRALPVLACWRSCCAAHALQV